MAQTPFIRPAYADSFRCIGSACEDTCCQGWSVPIDKETYDKYRQLPPSPLRDLILESISECIPPPVAVPAETGAPENASFSNIRMTSSIQCPLLTADRLCRIHRQCGQSFLSAACAGFPRLVKVFEGAKETALALSCPEAARLVLLNPRLFDQAALRMPHQVPPPRPAILAIRQAAVDLLRNRTYPLWQRLFLLSVFSNRIDAIAPDALEKEASAFLRDFETTLAVGALRPALETLPADSGAQLDVVLRLAGMLLHRSTIGPRFVECVEAFTGGIGNGPGVTLESLAHNFDHAHHRYFAPFFARNPHILENYLVNNMIRTRFPFGQNAYLGQNANLGRDANLGQDANQDGPSPSPPAAGREVVRLVAQFTLIKGLLIGVAGFHREHFSAVHVVHTVQTASKHFEHHPEFLRMAQELLAESRMDGARGLAILLRNVAPGAAGPEPRPASPAIHAPGAPGGRLA